MLAKLDMPEEKKTIKINRPQIREKNHYKNGVTT